MADPRDLRARAQQALRLANNMMDAKAEAGLRQLAADYMTAAEAAERETSAHDQKEVD